MVAISYLSEFLIGDCVSELPTSLHNFRSIRAITFQLSCCQIFNPMTNDAKKMAPNNGT